MLRQLLSSPAPSTTAGSGAMLSVSGAGDDAEFYKQYPHSPTPTTTVVVTDNGWGGEEKREYILLTRMKPMPLQNSSSYSDQHNNSIFPSGPDPPSNHHPPSFSSGTDLLPPPHHPPPSPDLYVSSSPSPSIWPSFPWAHHPPISNLAQSQSPQSSSSAILSQMPQKVPSNGWKNDTMDELTRVTNVSSPPVDLPPLSPQQQSNHSWSNNNFDQKPPNLKNGCSTSDSGDGKATPPAAKVAAKRRKQNRSSLSTTNSTSSSPVPDRFCPKCNCSISHLSAKGRHIAQCQRKRPKKVNNDQPPQKRTTERSPATVDPTDPYICCWCRFITLYKGNMKRHLIACHQVPVEVLEKLDFDVERLRKKAARRPALEELPIRPRRDGRSGEKSMKRKKMGEEENQDEEQGDEEGWGEEEYDEEGEGGWDEVKMEELEEGWA